MDNKSSKELLIMAFDITNDAGRNMMERIWYRNILYYMGEQWIEWLTTTKTFARRKRRRNVPTPVSNIIRDYVRTMMAMILNKEFVVRVWPNSEELQDREAARLGESLIKHMDTDNDEAFAEEKELIALWTVVTGTTFCRTFPEMEYKGKVMVPKGKITDQHVLPFNVVVDRYGNVLKRKRYIGIKGLKSKEWVEDTYKQKVNVEDDKLANYERSLMRIVGNVSPWKGDGMTVQTFEDPNEELVLLKEIEVQPTKKYPEGRFIVGVGDKVLVDMKKMPIPVEEVDGEKVWEYTLTDFHYSRVPGRFWSDAGINDLISPQNIINQIDQALEMNRKGLGRPIVLTSSDMTIKRLNEFGSAFIALQYDNLSAQGNKPEIHNGTALPEQFLRERENHKNVAQDSAGDPKGVLRGKAPSSQSSGVMVDILKEAAEQSHVPDIARFYRAISRVNKKRLILAQKLYTEKRMLKIIGKGNQITIRAFKGSELYGNTDVRLELSSGISSTNAGKAQTLIRLAEVGWFGDVSQNPEVRRELLKRVGLSGFNDTASIDIMRAERENSILAMADKDSIIIESKDGKNVKEGAVYSIDGIYTEAIQKGPDGNDLPTPFGNDPLFNFDDDAIHIEEHRKLLLSPEFEDMMPQAQAVAILHTEAHSQRLEKKQQEALALEKALEKGGAEGTAPEEAI